MSIFFTCYVIMFDELESVLPLLSHPNVFFNLVLDGKVEEVGVDEDAEGRAQGGVVLEEHARGDLLTV